ncbi:Phosphatidylinositol transfer protein alpha isoform [Dictyocoela muelleri]|nr:Phosphatidylinositol transfer protein alpha isoform [Dictyocoela muelleri]
MTIIQKLYIIKMPFTLKEYEICQLYTAAKMSIDESKDDAGLEIKENKEIEHEVFGKCQKTYKVMYLNDRVPWFVRSVLPSDSLILDEISYNAFPKCHTTYTNRYFSPDVFTVIVESDHKEGPVINKNILEIDEKIYKKIEKDKISLDEKVIDEKYNPSAFSKKIDRPLDGGSKIMVCYKYVTIKFESYGLGWIAYEFERRLRDIFLGSHQRMYCTFNEWKNLTMDDIRNLEDEAKKILDKKKDKYSKINKD